ncbi:MAG: excinuclease ABC subunit UvrB [Candidatus Moeniiplasma glomeromycotorum]|nr:excinuclease ABC subunit UvrB [Candidatus Moeniiplasma glomeromycotorum]MCE8167110.1 excinuclease ABC subunit UvrB [Candidatus Moeniiplasma glomeromycotorum]MCE8168878.1 excinuclease ABC subunit UvrB [Candidatus Moeniiplasma glomeromycotorum]
MFKLRTNFAPRGDQPKAIRELVEGIQNGQREQVLLGATGTGKTFTMAQVIDRTQKSTLILAHNKTLAMQIYQEMQGFFPHNRVEYYVSYFDYFRPEAYKWEKDIYLEKRTQRNNQIVKMRLRTLNSLINGEKIIVVASVAAIYGCFSRSAYQRVVYSLHINDPLDLELFRQRLNFLGYSETKKMSGGGYKIKENTARFMLAWEDNHFFQIKINQNRVSHIELLNLTTNEKVRELDSVEIPPGQDYVGEEEEAKQNLILHQIEQELATRQTEFIQAGKSLEAGRLTERVNKDLFNLREMGFCPGMENYSRYFDGRQAGETPFTLLDYFPDEFLTIIDESHITIPQLKGMYNTNRQRLTTLIKYGWRLPSAADNRPLNREEFFSKIFQKSGYLLYVSATPGDFELAQVNYRPVEQIIRPTGLLDPQIEVRNSRQQINDIIVEIKKRNTRGEKVLIYALTIAMSEDIASYLQERYIKVIYLHSRLDIFDRYQAITSLRRGVYDVIVGINLLKEGIDLPEVSLVCILDADKPGFLRDTRSLIQIIGRASRNQDGQVILYAAETTKNMQAALQETNRRRSIQIEYNQKNEIIPQTIQKPVKDILLDPSIATLVEKAQKGEIAEKEIKRLIKMLKRSMKRSTREFRFDQAIAFRNALLDLEKLDKTLAVPR